MPNKSSLVAGLNPSQFLDQEVFPKLYLRLDSIFPEFGFKEKNGHWVASQEVTRSLPGAPRPGRVFVYADRPYGLMIQGGDFVPWLSYLGGGEAPRGPAFFDLAGGLCEQAGLDPSVFQKTLSSKEQKELDEWQRKQGLFSGFLELTRAALRSSPKAEKAREYLLEKRGFTQEEIEHPDLPLGFYSNPQEITKQLESLDYTEQEIKASGVVTDGRWKSRLVGAWHDHTGRIATFFARSLGSSSEKDKYLYLKGGKKPEAFGLNTALRTPEGRRELVVVEGLLDVVLFQIRGFPNMVGLGGSGSLLTQSRWKLLTRHQVESFTLAFDHDQTGLEGTLKAIDAAFSLPELPELHVIPPELYPEGIKDPDELLREHGMDVWLDYVGEKSHAMYYRAIKFFEQHSSTWKAKGPNDGQLIRVIKDAATLIAPVAEKEKGFFDLQQFFWPLFRERLGVQQEFIDIYVKETIEKLKARRQKTGPNANGIRRTTTTKDLKLKNETLPNRRDYRDIESLLGPIEWTWWGWLPSGLLTILASEPGIGKSALALQLAKTFVLGEPWPDGSPYLGKLGAILWCEAEAAQAINLERIKSQGLPLEKIHIPVLEEDPLADLQLDRADHKEALRRAAEDPEVRFIVIDSLRGCHRRDENASETIEVVMWLARLARDLNKPLLLTHHLRKRGNQDNKGVSLDRLRGSSALIQPARVIWAMSSPDAEDPEYKCLSVIKSNIGKFPSPLGFTVDERGLDFGEPPEKLEQESLLEKTQEWLLQELAEGPRILSELYEAGESSSIGSKSTIRLAKRNLDIRSAKVGGIWQWFLPIK